MDCRVLTLAGPTSPAECQRLLDLAKELGFRVLGNGIVCTGDRVEGTTLAMLLDLQQEEAQRLADKGLRTVDDAARFTVMDLLYHLRPFNPTYHGIIVDYLHRNNQMPADNDAELVKAVSESYCAYTIHGADVLFRELQGVITTKTRNVLCRHGILCVAMLREMSVAAISDLPNISRETAERLLAAIAALDK